MLSRLCVAVAALGVALALPRATLGLGAGGHVELGRRLVGDWETPATLLVSFNKLWPTALTDIVKASGDRAIMLLIRPNDSTEAAQWQRGISVPMRVVHRSHESDWVRDFGPIQVRDPNGAVRWLDAEYQDDRPNDNSIPERLVQHGTVVESLPFRLDGGALVSNGMGLCAITRRNFADLEIDPRDAARLTEFKEQVGCRTLVILPSLVGESTGHADLFVHFFAPNVVGVASMDPSESVENARRLDLVAQSLVAAADTLDIALRVVRVPMPIGTPGVFYSYVNAVTLGDKILVPHFESVAQPIEESAHAVIRAASGREIIPIAADLMAVSGGALHCIVLGLFVGSHPSEYGR